MKRILFVLILGIFLVNLISAYPKIVPYVNDYANILSEEEEINLNLILDKIEENTTYEIAIVTVKNTEGQNVVEYANRIGDENGVGKKDTDNGIVILWSLDNEKGGAIATGRGSESIFNDAKVGRIGRSGEDYFYNGSYYGGFIVIIDGLNNELTGQVINSDEDSSQINYALIFLLLIGAVFLVISSVNSLSNSRGSGGYSSSGYSGSSRGFGSSGTSFGGGSFGGGGAGFGGR